MLSEKQRALLAEELESDRIKTRKGSGGKFDYLEGWDVKRQANKVFGYDGWDQIIVARECVAKGSRIKKARNPRDDDQEVFYAHYLTTVRIAVRTWNPDLRVWDVVTREDTGYGNGEDRNPGAAHELASKESVTDAVKRAFSGFGPGFGLSLYDKDGDYRSDDFEDDAPGSRSGMTCDDARARREEDERDEPDDREVVEKRRDTRRRSERLPDGERKSSERIEEDARERDGEVADDAAREAHTIRERVERRVSGKREPRVIEPPKVAARATYAERKRTWTQWSKLVSAALRACRDRAEADATVEANRKNLEALTEASRRRKDDPPAIDGVKWALGLVDEFWREDAEEREERGVEPGSGSGLTYRTADNHGQDGAGAYADSSDEPDIEPDEYGHLPAPIPQTPARWEEWRDRFGRMIEHTRDLKDAIVLIGEHEKELEQYSSFENADMIEWARGHADSVHRADRPSSTRSQRSRRTTDRGRSA